MTEKENRIHSLALSFLGRQQIIPNLYADQIIRGYKEGYQQAEKDLKVKEVDMKWSDEDNDYFDAIIAKLEVTQDDALLTDNQMQFLKSIKQRIGE